MKQALLMNAYEYLDVEEDVKLDRLRKAYLARAKVFHPDCGGKSEEFLNLQRAYEILKNSELKDRLGSLKLFQCPGVPLSPRDKIFIRNLERLRRERTERRFQ